EKTNAGLAGKLINPSGNETVLDEVRADDTHLYFSVKKLELSYEGVWQPQEHAWNGKLTFQQVYPLTLKRATAEDIGPAVHKRPQEDAIAAAHPTYFPREIVFDNPAAHIRLAGTLTLPAAAGPFPAIVLISGTGHNTRDEDVWGHKVFLVLADALSRNGFAVLRYDKRGVARSTGSYDAATTADFTSDAQAAVAWLKTQPHIDPLRIGVLGHSEGGLIAPAVAASDHSVAFVVMIAGPCVRGDKLFVLQSAKTSQAYGAPADYIAKRKLFDQAPYDAIINARSQTAALQKANALVAKALADKLVDANEAESLAKDDTSPWERYFLSYDPKPILARLTVPVLVLNGSLDVQVPATENLAAAREALKNNPTARIIELQGMNHLLQSARSGAPNEYNEIEETMSPSALKIITDWLAAVARTTTP
ncbi:MAG TPA: alpha/beta fold hydrolase, partial [Candidatus Acidoferrum sp.]